MDFFPPLANLVLRLVVQNLKDKFVFCAQGGVFRCALDVVEPKKGVFFLQQKVMLANIQLNALIQDPTQRNNKQLRGSGIAQCVGTVATEKHVPWQRNENCC